MEQKVKLLKTYKIIKDSTEEKLLQEIQEFDLNGNLIYSKEYDDSGNIEMEVKAEFDENGKPIKETTINYIDDIEETNTFTYDESGKLLSERTDNKQGWFSVKKYERLNDGKTVRVTLVDEDDEPEEITEVELNEKGDIVSNKLFDENNKLTEAQKNKYNEEGVLILREELDHKGKIEKAHHYYYTDSKKIQAVKTLNRKGKTIDWVKVEYDESDRPVEQFTMSGAKFKMEYNEDGSVTESQFSPGGEEISRNTNFYDEKHNLIKQEHTEYIIIYEHEYFD